MDAGSEETFNSYGYGYGYGYGMANLPSYPSPISMSALDKFLGHSSSSSSSSSTSSPRFVPTLEDHEREMRNAFGEFSPFSSSPSWMFQRANCISNNVDYYVTLDEEDEMIFNGGGVINFDRGVQRNGFIMGSAEAGMKRGRGGSPSNFLIKGQWTEDEDSILIELVEDLGLRKWAMIAEKLFGRTGKQCRERWQNHLRPDIKKDSWTEEEEIMLVKAHQFYGNKWAEIAKKIPGRTENSIKNHWNATKRRQNSKRKSKKLVDARSGKPKSCVLQDYIKKLMSANHSEDLSDTDSSSLLDCGCDDEIIFMQKTFKDVNMNHPIAPQLVTHNDQVSSVVTNNPGDLFQMAQATTGQESVMDIDPNDKATGSKPLSSDLYMAQLLEGAGYLGSSPFSCFTNEGEYNFKYNEVANEDEMEMENHNIYQENKDMDLMEMVYARPNQPFGSPLWG